MTNDDKTENTETKSRCRCKKRTNLHFYLEPTCIILSSPDGDAEVQSSVVLMPHSSHKRAIATCAAGKFKPSQDSNQPMQTHDIVVNLEDHVRPPPWLAFKPDMTLREC